MEFTALPAYQPLVLCSVALVFKMGAVAFATANARRKAKVVVNREDMMVNPGAVAEAQEAPETLRCQRAHRNDVENIPGFLLLAMLFALSGGSARAAWAYFGVYTVVRVLHTVFYLNEKQPFRTICFGIGQLCQLGLAVNLVLQALRH